MTSREKMSPEHKSYFFYGYAYRLAEEAKQDGCFPELTTMQLCDYFLETLVIPKLEAKQSEHLRRGLSK